MIVYHKLLTTIFVANMHLQISSPLGKRMASNSHVYIGWFIMAPYYSQPLWEWLDIYFQYGVHEWLMFIGKLVGTVLRGNEEYQS